MVRAEAVLFVAPFLTFVRFLVTVILSFFHKFLTRIRFCISVTGKSLSHTVSRARKWLELYNRSPSSASSHLDLTMRSNGECHL